MMKHILTELIDTVEPTVQYGFMLYGELLLLREYDTQPPQYQLITRMGSYLGVPTLGEWLTSDLMAALLLALGPGNYSGKSKEYPQPNTSKNVELVAVKTWSSPTATFRAYIPIPLPPKLPADVVLEEHTLRMGEQERTLYTTYMGGDLKVLEVYYIPAYGQLVLCIARISGEYLLLVQTEGDVVDMYGHAGN